MRSALEDYRAVDERLLGELGRNPTLEEIAEEYAKVEDHLRELGKDFIDQYLYDIDRAGIHSYRYRVKEKGHLLEKIIRKKKENPEKLPGFSKFYIEIAFAIL